MTPKAKFKFIRRVHLRAKKLFNCALPPPSTTSTLFKTVDPNLPTESHSIFNASSTRARRQLVPFERLPPEIHNHIATYLSPISLMSLKLCNRRTYHYTTTTYSSLNPCQKYQLLCLHDRDGPATLPPVLACIVCKTLRTSYGMEDRHYIWRLEHPELPDAANPPLRPIRERTCGICAMRLFRNTLDAPAYWEKRETKERWEVEWADVCLHCGKPVKWREEAHAVWGCQCVESCGGCGVGRFVVMQRWYSIGKTNFEWEVVRRRGRAEVVEVVREWDGLEGEGLVVGKKKVRVVWKGRTGLGATLGCVLC